MFHQGLLNRSVGCPNAGIFGSKNRVVCWEDRPIFLVQTPQKNPRSIKSFSLLKHPFLGKVAGNIRWVLGRAVFTSTSARHFWRKVRRELQVPLVLFFYAAFGLGILMSALGQIHRWPGGDQKKNTKTQRTEAFCWAYLSTCRCWNSSKFWAL